MTITNQIPYQYDFFYDDICSKFLLGLKNNKPGETYHQEDWASVYKG